MKNILLIGLFFMAAVFGYAQNGTIEVVCEDFAPYFSASLPNDGILGGIVREAFKNAGYQVHINYIPYARAVMYIKEGKYPVNLGTWSVFANDPEKVNISYVSCFNVAWRFFSYDKPVPQYKELKDLKGFKIGTYLGAMDNPIFAENGLKVEEKTNMDSLVKMLQMNRLDLVSITDAAFIQKAKELFPTEIEKFKFEKPWIVVDGSVMFSNKHPDGLKFYKIFLEESKKLNSSGYILSSLEKYYGKGKVPEDIYKK
jgi:polar amino acid transport system substrate-binding protein